MRSHGDSILRLHLRLHAILSGVALLITCLDWGLTASHLSLLALNTVERCSSSDLALSILLAATSSDDLLAILILIYLSEWTHRSLTLSIVVLTQESIQVLRCSSRSSILATHSLDLALVIRQFPPAARLLATASSPRLEQTTLAICIPTIVK